MLERLETQEPFANARRLASTRERGTCGTKGVFDVMGTLDRELARLRKFDAPSPPVLDDERPVCIREGTGGLALRPDGYELDAALVQEHLNLGIGLENGIGDDCRRAKRHVREDLELCLGVGIEASVPGDVIGSDVEQDGDLRGKINSRS